MVEIRKTEQFAKWLDNLRDIQAKARVLVRIERLPQEILETLSRLVKESRKCGSSMPPVTGSTSSNGATN
jgi:hypothetical protein